jgi:hypothetical protein
MLAEHSRRGVSGPGSIGPGECVVVNRMGTIYLTRVARKSEEIPEAALNSVQTYNMLYAEPSLGAEVLNPTIDPTDWGSIG